jgi:hypothetical protein
MLLYWNFMKFSADNGYEVFDFGRSTEGEGTYRFKKQWGAMPRPLTWYGSIDNKNLKIEESPTDTNNREKLVAIWQRLPLRVANLVGPRLRKYISL